MNAFVKTEKGLFKVYRRGEDWQIIGPKFERWFSVWSTDKMGSLLRAIESVPGENREVEIISLSSVCN